MSVDDRDRPLQLDLGDRRQHSIEEAEHLAVRVGTTTEQDDANSIGALEHEQSRIVEVSRHDDAPLFPGGVDAFMPSTPEMRNRIVRHGHVHEKPHPLNSMTSSSARLTA